MIRMGAKKPCLELFPTLDQGPSVGNMSVGKKSGYLVDDFAMDWKNCWVSNFSAEFSFPVLQVPSFWDEKVTEIDYL